MTERPGLPREPLTTHMRTTLLCITGGKCTFDIPPERLGQLAWLVSPAIKSGRMPGKSGSFEMTHSNLSVEVQGTHILVVLRGTCFRAKYRKQEAPWLATDELGPDDPEAPITLSEFRSLAWTAANERARELGWIKSHDELHNAAKRAAG